MPLCDPAIYFGEIAECFFSNQAVFYGVEFDVVQLLFYKYDPLVFLYFDHQILFEFIESRKLRKSCF